MTPELTHEAREDLRKGLDRIDAAINVLRAARKPFDDAIAIMDAQRESLLEAHGIEDDFENCEGCSAMVLPNDKAHRCEDGPTLCVNCAPSWADMEGQILERIADLERDPDCGEERSIEELQQSLAAVRAHIADGDGDKKHVW